MSLPKNGGVPGPPVIHQAMINSVNGQLVDQIRSNSYQPPLTLPQFSYAVGKLRELMAIWPFGGPETWPRTRIDEHIERVHGQIADFLA